jgi:hypothetical protein
MSTWRVEQHYGFGAARIPIRPEAHRREPVGLRAGMRMLAVEFTDGGFTATLRRTAGEASGMMLGLLILLAVVVTFARDHSDTSAIELVMVDDFVTEPPPLVEAPVPEPIPEPEPLEVPTPEPPKPLSPPPPQQRIARETPPPPPAPKPQPARVHPRPEPVVPRVAQVEPPPPPQRMERPVRERPEPVARPRVRIDAARPDPVRRPAPTPATRVARTPSVAPHTRSTPRLEAPAAPAPELPTEAAPQRAFRVANARPAAGERARPLPGVAPATASPSLPDPAPTPRASRPTAPPRPTSRTTPRIAPSAPSAPRATPPRPSAPPQRSAHPTATPEPRRGPRPVAAMARVDSRPTRPAPELASRTGLAAPAPSRGASSDRPGLAGVPLGDLAACVSDREEDRLKQAVVAAVTTQEECVSDKGTYRFVETRNLNAFLMWIDRAPSRPVSDRCAELRNALECLQGAGRRAARL